MRKTITRTITATIIYPLIFKMENGKPTPEGTNPITVNGVLSEEKALKEVRKIYGQNAFVSSIKEVNDVYEISVDDFMKYATKVEVPNVPMKIILK
jgi:hypothetical protein